MRGFRVGVALPAAAAQAVAPFVGDKGNHIVDGIAQKQADFMRKRAALRKARAKQIHRVLNRQIRITLLGQKGGFLFTGEHAAKLAGPVKIAQRASVAHVDHADGQSFGRKFVG